MTKTSKPLFRTMAALLLTTGVVLAQDQPPAPPQTTSQSSGAWRRVGDPAPTTTTPATPQQQSVDPTEPVERSDSYGQPQSAPPQDMQQQQPPQSMPPQSMPPQSTPAQNMPPQNMPPQSMPAQSMPPQSMPPQATNRPAYGVPATITVRPGTFFTIRLNQGLASNHNKAGDVFTGTLTQPLIAGGVVVAQRGQTVAGTIAEIGKDKDGKNFMRLNVTSITAADGTQFPVQTQLSSIQGGSTPGGVEAGTVVATTAVGAAIGGVAAWGTGAAIGAGAGAIAGLAAVAATHNHPAVIYPETAVTFQLTAPAAVSTANAPQAFRFAGQEDYQPTPTLMRSGPPRPYPGAAYAYPGAGYAYPPAYYYGPGYYPYYYPYSYWGPGFGVVIGRGFGGRWR